MKKFSLEYCFHTCSKNTIAILSLFVFAVVLSCSTALYVPTAGDETVSASLVEMQAGRKLYVQKCGSCHSLFLPEKYNKQQWEHFLNEMQQKASINNDEKEQILKYLSKGL
jgi:mono/diheme cytochrome c family protein